MCLTHRYKAATQHMNVLENEMKKLIFVALVLTSINSFAVCPRPSSLPKEVKAAAFEKLYAMCPTTYNKDRLRVTAWVYSSVGEEFSHELIVEGQSSKFTLEVNGDCALDQEVFAGKIDIDFGCK